MKQTNETKLKLIALGLAAAIVPQISHAQAIEWEPDEGYHEEEWYDPSDWFDDDSSIDYEYYGGYWDEVTWYNEWGEDDATYEWNPVTNEWERTYDPYLYSYSYSVEFDEPEDQMNQQGQQGRQQSAQRSQQRDRQTDQQRSSDRSSQMSADRQSGQQSGSDRSSQNRRSQMSQRQQSQQSKSLEGEIDGFREVQVAHPAGFQETHALARVKLKDDKFAVIDLGSASLLAGDLQKGDKVTLRGTDGKINNQNVFIVNEFESGGETVWIDRAVAMSERSGKSGQQRERRASQSQQARSSGSQQQQDQQVTIEGEIDRFQSVELEGKSGKQSLVRIKLADGDAATVNLGPNTSLEDLNLEEGDKVRIKGKKEKIQGRSILSAESIRVEGEQIKGQSSRQRS